MRATVSSVGPICGGRPIEQQPLRRATPPEVVVRQRVDQRRVGRRAQARRCSRHARAVGHDPVDAAAIAPKGELRGVLVELAGRPLRVLDAGAVVVDDVQRAVGTDVEVHRPEPRVGGGQELARRPASTRDEGRARWLDHVAVHEVVHRLGDKRAARVLALEQPAGVERQAAGRGELARLGQQLVLRVGGDRKDARGAAVIGDRMRRRGHRAAAGSAPGTARGRPRDGCDRCSRT